MFKNDINANSGIVWNLLVEQGALPVRKIGELTGFREIMIVLALGWLAKENKIRFFEQSETIYVEAIYSNFGMHTEMYF